MDGVFLSPSEDEFVGRISEELERFLEQGQHQRVLLFPPLSSRLRYLIHRTVENMELLSSFSVGEGWRRRTVICHSAVRLPTETSSDQKPGTNPSRSQRPAQPWGRGGRGGTRLRHLGDIHGDNSRGSVGSGRITRPPTRRPDKFVYVSKGSRKKSNWRERENAEPEGEAAPGENCPKNSIGNIQGKDGGKQQEAEEEEDGEGKGSAEHPLCHGNSCGQENRDRDCSHSHEPSHANSVPAEFQRQEKQPSRNSRGLERGESSSPLENHSWTQLAVAESPELEKQSLESSRNKSSPAQQNPRNAQGSQSFSKENQEQESSRNKSSPAQQNPRNAQGSQSFSKENQEQESSRNKSSPAQQNPRNAQGSQSFSKENQEQESSRNKSSPAQQNPRNAQGSQSFSKENQEQESPQVEQKSLGNAVEGAGEAGADPGDPEQIQHSKEEEQQQEQAEVAAGDTEGTRQSTEDEDDDDDGTAELLAEIVVNLSVKEVSIDRVPLGPCREGDLGHVTEIYEFPPSLRTEDLMGMFSDFHESGFKIQWVDATHALGIFSSLSTASQALGRRYPCLKIRPLIHGTKQSKLKALQRPKLLQLGKERPQRDTAVAKRIVSHALGWRHRQQETPENEEFQPESLDQEE